MTEKIKKGFTMLPNKIFDLNLKPSTFLVLAFIFKWKNSDRSDLSLSFIENGTRLSRNTVNKALKELENNKCIIINRNKIINQIYPNMAFFELKNNINIQKTPKKHPKNTQKKNIKVKTKNINSAEEAFGPLR